MELELVQPNDPATVEAARRAVADVGAHQVTWPDRGRWWQAGVAESIGARPVTPVRGRGYDAAPSPRSTRGATRA